MQNHGPRYFVYEKNRVYPLIVKLYRSYQIYRNSSGAKKAAVCKIFTPVLKLIGTFPGSVLSGWKIILCILLSAGTFIDWVLFAENEL